VTIHKRCAALVLASVLVVAWRPDLAAQGLKLRVIQNAMAGDAVTIIDPATNTVVGEIPDIEISNGVAAAAHAAEVVKREPGFTVAAYLATQHYKRDVDRKRHEAGLLKAGLPP